MKKVKVYTSPSCSACARLKESLKRMSVEYDEVNLSENPDAAEIVVKKTGFLVVPVLEADGEFYPGPDEAKLKEILGS